MWSVNGSALGMSHQPLSLQPKSVRTKFYSPDSAEFTITWIFSLAVRSVFCPELLAVMFAKLFLRGKKLSTWHRETKTVELLYWQLHRKNWFIMKKNTIKSSYLGIWGANKELINFSEGDSCSVSSICQVLRQTHTNMAQSGRQPQEPHSLSLPALQCHTCLSWPAAQTVHPSAGKLFPNWLGGVLFPPIAALQNYCSLSAASSPWAWGYSFDTPCYYVISF